ncbi:hypothetical protein [Succinatimonas hippei]|nr:hypothetical protein [Succinatimonas hippei]
MPKTQIFHSLQEACEFANVVEPKHIIFDGKYHPADIHGDPNGANDARILLFKDKSGGIVWNWKAEEEKQKTLFFFSENYSRKGIKRTPLLNQTTQQINIKNIKAQELCFLLWEHAVFAKNDHPYLIKKKIEAQGDLKELSIDTLINIIGYCPKSSGKPLRGRILLAFRGNSEHQLCTVDFIDETGLKTSLYGGLSKGSFWSAQPLCFDFPLQREIALAEGVATAISIKNLFLIDSVAVSGCSNFIHVAKSMKAKNPKISLHIFADVGNGMEAALKAAQETDSKFYLPKFTKEMNVEFKKLYGKNPTDFNDYSIIAGV